MKDFLVELLTLYGPLALGWVGFVVCLWYIARLHASHRNDLANHREDFKETVGNVQHALDNNTKVLTALNVRLEERR